MNFCRLVLCMALYSSSVRAFSSLFARAADKQCFARNAARAMSTAAVETRNAFLEQENLPKFNSMEPKDLTPAVEELLQKMETDFEKLESKLAESKDSVDYDDVLPELERIQFGLEYCWGVAGHLNGVKNGEELREAYESNQPKIVQAMSVFKQSRPLFDALSAIQHKSKEEESFEFSQRRRAVENSLLAMRLGGVGLEGEAKERFNEIKMKQAALATTFSNNVLDETKAFSLTVDDPAKMKGVPDSVKAMWANAHSLYLNSKGEETTEMDAEKGPWRITLDMPSYIAVMSHMPDRSIRERVYKVYIQRASEKNPEKNNVPLIYEILKLKKEMADMLGFANYAELSLSNKMASSIQSVGELTDLIADKALPAAENEIAEITALARENGGDEYSEANLSKLAPWDITFWSERLKETKFDLTEEETKPYFALPAVLDGLFLLVKRLFNIDIRNADGEAETWHKDVQFFKVFDSDSGKHIASFFLDPYSRPEVSRCEMNCRFVCRV